MKKQHTNQKRCEKQMVSRERDINISKKKRGVVVFEYAHIRGGYESGANI